MLAVEQVIRSRQVGNRGPHEARDFRQRWRGEIDAGGDAGAAVCGRRAAACWPSTPTPTPTSPPRSGLPAELRTTVRTIAEERQLIEERTGARVREFGQMFTLNPEVADIAERYAVRHAGVDLLVLGAVAARGGRLRLSGERAAEDAWCCTWCCSTGRRRDSRHGSRHRAPGPRHGHGRGSDAGGGGAGQAQRGDGPPRARDGRGARHPPLRRGAEQIRGARRRRASGSRRSSAAARCSASIPFDRRIAQRRPRSAHRSSTWTNRDLLAPFRNLQQALDFAQSRRRRHELSNPNAWPRPSAACRTPMPQDAVRVVLDSIPDAPIWPQLPANGMNEQMEIQYSEGMPRVVIDREKERMYIDTTGDYFAGAGRVLRELPGREPGLLRASPRRSPRASTRWKRR